MTGLVGLLPHGFLLAADAAEPAAPTGLNRFIAPLLQFHPLAWGVILGGLALWLMLPRGNAKGRALGAVLGIAALGLFSSRLLPLGLWSSNVVFWILSAVTIVAAACTVTFRSPVYCAVWFAMTLTGTAGIFMVQGAQFLGVATIVVYAGAILVTFLFVLMLASPKGNAYYDRVSWEALLAAAAGTVLLAILSITIGKLGLNQIQVTDTAALQQNVLVPDHVARLGAELFGRHLIAVEVAGTLLLVALVGATAIVSAQRREDSQPGSQAETPSSHSRAPADRAGSAKHLQEAAR
ncbi:MAG TPA: NADH-quinone oxidoreductase subunit J [Pirellulales bacterium]|jgi:NADH-quinone oxidoreductase subunit J|nr:NADH-quinone oxidoreductase subunit J [Pirellulales bacterium]